MAPPSASSTGCSRYQDNTSLAIPATTLRKVLDDKDLVANPDCETFTRKYGEA